MKKVQFLIIIILLKFVNSQSFARSVFALCDDANAFCDLRINNIIDKFNLVLPIKYFSEIKSQLYVCMRRNSVSKQLDMKCTLNQEGSGSYQCISIVNNPIGTDNYLVESYNADKDLYPLSSNNTGPYINDPLIGSTFSLQLDVGSNEIYQIVAGSSRSLNQDSNRKYGYFHTLNKGSQTFIDGSVIMQKHYACFYNYHHTDYHFSLIFYGGVLRNSDNIMYMAFLSYLSSDLTGYKPTNTLQLSMWGCLSFARSHVAREMICHSSSYDEAFDMYSLYYTAPFHDTSINIKGKSDVGVLGASTNRTQNASYFYYISKFRKYQTGDVQGDQRIFKRQNPTFCYTSSVSNDPKIAMYPNDTRTSHGKVFCFTPDLTVHQIYTALSFVLILLTIGLQ